MNASTGELLKGGVRVRLPAQPFAILLILLERPAVVVTREQLRERVVIVTRDSGGEITKPRSDQGHGLTSYSRPS
ncbi:MAG TPA: hypothetical protein VE621_04905 [Bryobacteraceae bacterium]|nr:hypothetical protein [Bryobacteraceae bacterium]